MRFSDYHKAITIALLLSLTPHVAFALTIAPSGTEGVDQSYDPVTNTTTFSANIANAIIHPTTIVSKLLAGNVVLVDNIDPNVSLSNNTVINWNTAYNLIVNAKQHIVVGTQAQIVSQNIGNLILRANYMGETEGTLIPPVSSAPIILMNGGGGVKIYYRPKSFDAPTDFSGNIKLTAPGTATAYMLVNTPEDLIRMNWNVYGNYALARNIDASSLQNFRPIGAGGAPYSGKFDGQGYTIDHIKINLPTVNIVGFFGGVSNATIENLNLTNIQITGNGSVGGLIGSASNTAVNNVHVSGEIAGESGSGMLIGEGSYNVTVSQSYTEGNIKSTTGGTSLGGLIGTVGTGGVADCYSTATVLANGSTLWASGGGLIGRIVAYGGQFKNSFAAGSVKGSRYVGGIFGELVSQPGSLRSFYWDMATSGTTLPSGDRPLVPGTNGYNTAQMYRKSTYLDWNFDSVWGIDEGNGYPYLLWSKKTAPWTYMFNPKLGVRRIVG